MSLKLKKLAAGLFLACILAVPGSLGQMTAFAANTRIAFSDPSVMVGNEVTVTVKVTSDSDLEKAMVMLAYDPEALKFISGTGANGDAGAVKLQGSSDSIGQKALEFTLKFKAEKAGETQITVNSQEIYGGDSTLLTVDKQGNSTVKVTSPATFSKDATLKSLKISPGELTPEFSPSVEAYTAGVGTQTQDLVVNAVAANAGANVSLEGDKGLKDGENKVVVTVKAEDGTTVKKYSILVTRSEAGDRPIGSSQTGDSEAAAGGVTVLIDGKQYKAASSFEASMLPEGFEPEEHVLKGTSVMAGKGLEKDLTLFYLFDENGKGAFYIYNEKADSWSPFAELQTSSKSIVIVPLDAGVTVPAGFEKRVIQINGVNVTGWVAESESAKGADPVHCLFYGMNWNGDKGFYLYDKTESTLQRYFAGDAAFGSIKVQRYLLIGVSLLAALLLIALIVLLIKGRGGDGGGRRGSGRDKEQDMDERGTFPAYQEDRTSRVRQYTRQEYEERNRTDQNGAGFQTEKETAPKDAETDDFEMEASLEDFERKLTSRLAEGVQKAEQPQAVVKAEDLAEPQDVKTEDLAQLQDVAEPEGLTEPEAVLKPEVSARWDENYGTIEKSEHGPEPEDDDEILPSTVIKEHRKQTKSQSELGQQTGAKPESGNKQQTGDAEDDFEFMDLDM